MPASAPKSRQQSISPRWFLPAVVAGLVAITLATFLGLQRCGFINLDDLEYVLNNTNVNKGLNWSVFYWAFTHSYSCNWHPLTWLSHALDCQIFGLNAGGHHITNLVLHTLSTVILFLALRRMTGALWRSAFVAALFAIHPLHVESVAWIAERKDVLSGFFFMLTLYAYARYTEVRPALGGSTPVGAKPKPGGQNPKSLARETKDRGLRTVDSGASSFNASTLQRAWYATVLAFFALGLMSKPMLVTLPFVFLLLDYWPLRRLRVDKATSNAKALVWEKAPFFVLTAASCVITMLAQRASRLSLVVVPLGERLGNSALACVSYLRQAFWPADLAIFYPYPKHVLTNEGTLAAVVLLGLTTAILAARKRRYLLVGWLWFLGMLVPVIGLVQVGTQARADRYTYLPLIGIFVAVTWTAATFVQQRPRFTLAAGTAAAALVAGLGFVSHQQTEYWRTNKGLFEHAVRVIPENYFAMTELGMQELEQGNFPEAMTNLIRALEIEPTYPFANHHVGVALYKQGKPAEAIPYLQRAEVQPGLKAITRLALALAYIDTRQFDSARTALDQAAAERPGNPDVEVTKATLLSREGKSAEAEAVYRRVTKEHPEHGQAALDYAGFLVRQNRSSEAEPYFTTALRLQPSSALLHSEFAAALSVQGKFDLAVEQLRQARRLAPNDPMVHFELAQVLSQTRRAREAVGCYDKALELNPTFAGAMNNLAWILATDPADQVRNGRRAVELAEKACELTKWELPVLLGTLAAAYAEAGRFEDAAKTAERARDKAKAAREEQVARRNDELLQLYRSGKPYRETPKSLGPSGNK